MNLYEKLMTNIMLFWSKLNEVIRIIATSNTSWNNVMAFFVTFKDSLFT
jgi:hypothetical protein